MIAATADVHDLIVVTRNVRDLEQLGLRTLNPFTLITKSFDAGLQISLFRKLKLTSCASAFQL